MNLFVPPKSRSIQPGLVRSLLASTALIAVCGSTASAQQPPQSEDAQQLPPIVVQGATLAPSAKRKTSVGDDQALGSLAEKPKPNSKPTPADATGAPLPPFAATADGGSFGSGSGAGGIPLDQIGASVTVVTGAQIGAQQLRSSADLLRGLPGVAVTRSGGFGNLTNVSLRGGSSAQTLVLVDGVEVNDPSDGAFDFSSLSAEEIDRMEVIRGPMSGIYGSKAVGGVINIITKGGRGPLTLSLRAEGGSFDSGDIAARLSGGNDKAYLAIGLSEHVTRGFNIAPIGDEKDDSKLTTFSFKAGATITDGVTVDMNLRKITKSADRDGFGGNIGQLQTAVDDPSKLEADLLVFGASLRWDSLDGHLTQIFRTSHSQTTNTDHDRGSFGPTDTTNEGSLTKYAYLATYRFAAPALLWTKHALTAIVEHDDEDFTPSGDFADGILRTRSRNSLGGEYSVDFANRLTVTGNIRHDMNDKFADYDTWRAATSLRLTEIGLRPHASVGTSVKFPTMFEQFGSTALFAPNPLLKPEESTGWDAGLEFTFAAGRAIFDVTYFHADVRNAISTVFSPKFTAVNNTGQTIREGVELSARARVTPELTLGAAYTWLQTRDPNGIEEIRRPSDTARLDLNYALLAGRANLNVAAIYSGSRSDIGVTEAAPFTYVSSRVSLEDYWLLNVAASYKIAPGLEVFARGENLLDAKYQEIYGYQPAGIAGYAGVRITLEEPSTAAWAKYRD